MIVIHKMNSAKMKDEIGGSLTAFTLGFVGLL